MYGFKNIICYTGTPIHYQRKNDYFFNLIN